MNKTIKAKLKQTRDEVLIKKSDSFPRIFPGIPEFPLKIFIAGNFRLKCSTKSENILSIFKFNVVYLSQSQ